MLIAYHGDPALKAAFLATIEHHEQSGQLIKGKDGQINGMWHGSAVGCSLRSLNLMQGLSDPNVRTDLHSRYEAELGFPVWSAYLEDHIFEQLPSAQSVRWPRRFAEAVPVGAVA